MKKKEKEKADRIIDFYNYAFYTLEKMTDVHELNFEIFQQSMCLLLTYHLQDEFKSEKIKENIFAEINYRFVKRFKTDIKTFDSLKLFVKNNSERFLREYKE
jgi:hypothetical protein